MLQSLTNLKPFVKFGRRPTETFVFFLNYRITCLILLFFCSLIFVSKNFVTDKIKCLSRPTDEVNVNMLNSYCWATSTYTFSSAYLKDVGTRSPHSVIEGSENQTNYEYRNFYQYMHIVLFIQAILFYLPHFIWKNFEPDYISVIPKVIVHNTKDESYKSSLENISEFLKARWGRQKSVAVQYMLCEFATIINILAQMFLLNVFFNGKYLDLRLLFNTYYHSEVLTKTLQLFPLVTVCNFRTYGPSGFIDEVDALCVLPLNILYAKIFLSLWIWFIGLIVLSVINVMLLTICMTVPYFRILWQKITLGFQEEYLESYEKLMTEGDFGDWFILSSFMENIDQLSFSRIADRMWTKVHSLKTD